MYGKIIVWFNPNSHTYYYRLVRGYYAKYEIGYKNSYDHEVILIIDIYRDLVHKEKITVRVLKKLISFLQNILKKLWIERRAKQWKQLPLLLVWKVL